LVCLLKKSTSKDDEIIMKMPKLKLPEKEPESWQVEKLRLAKAIVSELKEINIELHEIKKILKDLTGHE